MFDPTQVEEHYQSLRPWVTAAGLSISPLVNGSFICTGPSVSADDATSWPCAIRLSYRLHKKANALVVEGNHPQTVCHAKDDRQPQTVAEQILNAMYSGFWCVLLAAQTETEKLEDFSINYKLASLCSEPRLHVRYALTRIKRPVMVTQLLLPQIAPTFAQATAILVWLRQDHAQVEEANSLLWKQLTYPASDSALWENMCFDYDPEIGTFYFDYACQEQAKELATRFGAKGPQLSWLREQARLRNMTALPTSTLVTPLDLV